MSKLTTLRLVFRRFCANESGGTAIEYALVAAGVGVVIAGVVQGLGTNVKTSLYDKVIAVLP
ncbi:MAG: Flp family type IVb pilin [Pseudomonadota bacterium]